MTEVPGWFTRPRVSLFGGVPFALTLLFVQLLFVAMIRSLAALPAVSVLAWPAVFRTKCQLRELCGVLLLVNLGCAFLPSPVGAIDASSEVSVPIVEKYLFFRAPEGWRAGDRIIRWDTLEREMEVRLEGSHRLNEVLLGMEQVLRLPALKRLDASVVQVTDELSGGWLPKVLQPDAEGNLVVTFYPGSRFEDFLSFTYWTGYSEVETGGALLHASSGAEGVLCLRPA